MPTDPAERSINKGGWRCCQCAKVNRNEHTKCRGKTDDQAKCVHHVGPSCRCVALNADLEELGLFGAYHAGRENRGAPAGVLVTVCGPRGLAEDVRKSVRRIESGRRKRAGGVELHDE